MSANPGPPPSSASAKLLRNGDFDRWVKEFNTFHSRIRENRSSATKGDLEAMQEQLHLATASPRSIPLQHRYRLWRAWQEVWKSKIQCNEGLLLLLTSTDDVDVLGEFHDLNEAFRGQLLAEGLIDASQNRTGDGQFEELCCAIGEALLNEGLHPEGVTDSFLRRLGFDPWEGRERAELHQLLMAAGERGLQLLLTLMQFNLDIRVSRQCLQSLLLQDEVYLRLNDPQWPPDARDLALNPKSIKWIVGHLDQFGLIKQKEILWGVLARDFDHRLLAEGENVKTLQDRFELMREYRSSMPPQLGREIDDWSGLAVRCGPLWPKLSDKTKQVGRWFDSLPVPNPRVTCLAAALLGPFLAGLVWGFFNS